MGCQRDHGRAAEAETDRANFRRVDLRLGLERGKAGLGAREQGRRVLQQRHDDFDGVVEIVRDLAIAEHIGGQRDIAEIGQHPSPLHHMIAKAKGFVNQQNAGPWAAGLLVIGEVSAAQEVAVLILKICGFHGSHRRLGEERPNGAEHHPEPSGGMPQSPFYAA